MLDSIPDEIPKIVIDGRFIGHKGEPLSPKTMRYKVKSYPNVTLIDAPDLTEVEKRNLSLDQDYKYCLVIDSDEYVTESDWPSFFKVLSKIQDGMHQLVVNDATYKKIIVNPREWDYSRCHNLFYNKVTGITSFGHKIEGDILWDIILSHDDDLRDEQYVKDREEWQRIQISEENVVRSEYHIPELSR